MRRRLLSLTFLLAAGTIEVACNEIGLAPPHLRLTADQVSLSVSSATIKVGQTLQLNLQHAHNGLSMNDSAITWRSENPGVATVSKTGLVTGVSPGKAQIDALNGGGTKDDASSAITVVGCDCWSTKTSMPTGRAALGAAVINGILYAVGGLNPTALATVEAYDPTTDSWTTKASMPTARYNLGVAAINGILYSVGGIEGGSGTSLATVEAYDPATNTWTAKTPMPTARGALGVAVINGILYAVGGQGNGISRLATNEAYDPSTNTWTTKTPMPTGRSGPLGVAAMNGIVYAVGGVATNIQVATVEAYDPTSDSWTTRTSMPTARDGLGAAAIDDVLYAVGGAGTDGLIRATVEAYVAGTDTWMTKASMPTPRTVSGGVVAIGGILYALGGETNTGGLYLATLEAYRP